MVHSHTVHLPLLLGALLSLCTMCGTGYCFDSWGRLVLTKMGKNK